MSLEQEDKIVRQEETIEDVGRKRRYPDPFSNISKKVSEEDLKNSGVQRMLINENNILKKFEGDYYEAEKERAILNERLQNIKPLSTMYDICLSIGALLMGISFSISDIIQKIILFILGTFLLAAVIYNKRR